jgi:hypothetical protein
LWRRRFLQLLRIAGGIVPVLVARPGQSQSLAVVRWPEDYLAARKAQQLAPGALVFMP